MTYGFASWINFCTPHQNHSVYNSENYHTHTHFSQFVALSYYVILDNFFTKIPIFVLSHTKFYPVSDMQVYMW